MELGKESLPFFFLVNVCLPDTHMSLSLVFVPGLFRQRALPLIYNELSREFLNVES